jgi:hypothetical protein
MEAFESFVALALEADGLVVSEAVKFPVTRQTRRVSHTEIQTHHYEVDLVGARADKLVLATVKSFFGSRGVVAAQVKGMDNSRWDRLYAMINDPVIRDAVLAGASERFGYSTAQIELRLYVGKFAGGSRRNHEAEVREWAANQTIGPGPIHVYGVKEVAAAARRLADTRTYRDNPAVVAIKVLEAAGMLTPLESDTREAEYVQPGAARSRR